MHDRKKYASELVDLQEAIRIETLFVYYGFDFGKIDVLLLRQEKIENIFFQIFQLIGESEDKIFFLHYQYLQNSVFHLLRWAKGNLTASPTALNHLQSAKLNAGLIDSTEFAYPESFIRSLAEIIQKIVLLDVQIKELKDIFNVLKNLSYPVLFEIGKDHSNNTFKGLTDKEVQGTEDEKTPVVSLEFFVDQEPWANPQILQPGKAYNLQGRVRINVWPKNCEQLILHPISSESSTNYILELPTIYPFQEDSMEVKGTVVFKYPQHSFEDNLSVRLLCYFQRSDGEKIMPLVIGYDQLVAKVQDPNSYEFMTGFSSMTRALSDVVVKLTQELPMLDKIEKDNFLKLLRGILNYQGYCLQQGVYKNESSVSESVFRDRLIQHLIGIPYLGESITKEAELAGGRVEISFHGITAELKSETQISNRQQMMDKYGNQSLAYASGNGKQVSILCILDLTEKVNPSAPPRNNVVFRTMDVHGFQNSDLTFPPKQVIIFIDGNTKRPSDYSR